ncbi:uncharacterized protein LOC121398199 [Xenopus laevis]|uniref:Uncharacterized protein LOC121398199 n=2 Tax=Xenopus laevis TaxID=8355 RepID=A0A1L8EZ01_XENLA|nr:uncharacterized protein LOC121398199 [Xenopus laevis]XP_041432981.1 uncharacterized protein LOC121398199 [Xenopus laevis]OCT64567.1 hypothetical protein XELAEV_18045666mg [Xenopus laevis]
MKAIVLSTVFAAFLFLELQCYACPPNECDGQALTTCDAKQDTCEVIYERTPENPRAFLKKCGYEAHCKEHQKNFEGTVTCCKETRDYTSGIVYSWQGGSPRQQTRSNNFGLPRHRPEAGAPLPLYTRRTPPPPRSTDSDSDERFSSESERGTHGYRGSPKPFLGEQRKQNRREPDWRGTRGAHAELVAGGYLPNADRYRGSSTSPTE